MTSISRTCSGIARPALLLLLALACLVLPAGCRSTADPTGVVIGLAAPFEGGRRELGYAVLAAVRLAVAEQNDAGGVAGRPVSIVALNDEDVAGLASWQARKFAVDPAVFGVIGHWSHQATAAALPEYRRAGLPLVIPHAGDLGPLGRGIVALGPGDGDLVAAAVNHTAAAGYARIALDVAPPDLELALSGALTAAGRQIVVPAAPADVLILAREYEAAGVALRDTPASDVIMLDDLYWPILAALWAGRPDAPGPPSDRHLLRWTLLPAEAAAFDAAYRAETGHAPPLQAYLAYDAARYLLTLADQAARDADRNRPLRAALWERMGEDVGFGLTGPLRFDQAGRRDGLQLRFISPPWPR